jgi:hypothetical protein
MAAQAQTAPATGTATVTVACKIPQGFILKLFEKKEITEVTLGGSRTVKQFFPTGDEFRLNGSAHAQNEGPRCHTVGGFAITDGVPKDFWNQWLDQNRTLPAVQNGMIIAFDSAGKTVGAAKEGRTIKTGLERLNPHDLPVLDPRFKLQTADNAVAQIGHVEE